MGAILWREALGSLPSGTHGSTFGGNPLACAASRVVLRTLEKEQLPARAARLGNQFIERLNASPPPLMREVRGWGLMIGIELRQRVTPILKKLMDRGVLAQPAGPTVIRLLPPLVFQEEEWETVLQTIQDVLKDAD